MSAPADDSPDLIVSEVVELPVEACLDLLGQHHLGRVAFLRDGAPELLPVNYVLHEGTVVFRTGDGGLLAQTHRADVAFQVDHVDPGWGTGWSVVVRGKAEEVWQIAELNRLRQLELRPWAPGERAHYVGIAPRAIVGRRIV